MAIDWAALNLFLERWGFPVLVLVVIGMAVWFGIWPVIKERIARQDKLFDQQQTKLEQSLVDYQARLSERDRAFTASLAELVNSQAASQVRIVQALNEHDTKSGQQHAQIAATLADHGDTLKVMTESLQQVNASLSKIARASERPPRRRIP